MYSTCLFCQTSLGKNESIEHFPVGRRLAFDAAKGRLWVVCGTCERWNLTPLEERWEAIEECERAFRDTRLRVSTDNVGLARLREGTTLVRIGQPQRPELAAWRYGDQFGRRRRRFVLQTGAGIAAVGGFIVAGPLGLGLAGGGMLIPVHVANLVQAFWPEARIVVGNERYRVDKRQLSEVELRPNDEAGFELRMSYTPPWRTRIVNPFAREGPHAMRDLPYTVTLTGDNALSAARTLLPRVNARGGTNRTVRDALDIIEATPKASDLFARMAGPRLTHGPWWTFPMWIQEWESRKTLSTLLPAWRLALEMSLHEDDERRALEGELATLEGRWKEAEEIAAISDDMFLPTAIVDRLRSLR